MTDEALPGADWRDAPEGSRLTNEQAARRFLDWDWDQQLRYMTHVQEAMQELHDLTMGGITRESARALDEDRRRVLAEVEEMKRGEQVPAPLVTFLTAQAYEEGKYDGARQERHTLVAGRRGLSVDGRRRDLTRQQPADHLTTEQIKAAYLSAPFTYVQPGAKPDGYLDDETALTIAREVTVTDAGLLAALAPVDGPVTPEQAYTLSRAPEPADDLRLGGSA